MVSLREVIDDKYGEKDNENEAFEFIMFVSCSPEEKRGMFPPLMILNDYNIEYFGDFSDFTSKIRHIRELDLAENLLSDWSVVLDILFSFRSLTFLNISNNLFNEWFTNSEKQMQENLKEYILVMKKVVL